MWQCPDGHVICELCADRPEVKCCPQCRTNLYGKLCRNRALENLSWQIFPMETGGTKVKGQEIQRKEWKSINYSPSHTAPRPAYIQTASLAADMKVMIPAVKTEYRFDNQDVPKVDGGGEYIEYCVSARVKPEPTNTSHSAQDINQNMVQLEQAMIVDDMNQQEDSIVDQYEESYGVDYDEQPVGQGYGEEVAKQVDGQEASGTGQIFCQKCNKFVVAHNFKRHTKDVHGRISA